MSLENLKSRKSFSSASAPNKNYGHFTPFQGKDGKRKKPLKRRFDEEFPENLKRFSNKKK